MSKLTHAERRERYFYFQTPERRRELLFDSIDFDTNGGCWLWNRALGAYGYGLCNRWIKEKKKSYPAHRESYSIFKGEIPKGMLVCHKCDVRSCVNPNHLFLGTDLDNIRDMDRKGRRKNAKTFKRMTEEQKIIARDKSISVHEAARQIGFKPQSVRWHRRNA